MIAQFTLTVNIFICFCIDKCILVCYNVKATLGAWRAVVRALGERARTIKLKNQYFSGCSAVGSARALGARCRRFESCHSDHQGTLVA